MRARGVKEAAGLGLNRIKAEEWTPCRFPITAEFTQPRMAEASTLSYTPSVYACVPPYTVYDCSCYNKPTIKRPQNPEIYIALYLCWSLMMKDL